MLAMYGFNNILCYLNDNNYEKIYDKESLVVLPNNYVYHKIYKFIFNHDYDVKDSIITNYDFIKYRFDLKIKNFKEMLANDTKTIFINFSHDVNSLNIDEMLCWLKKNKKNFYLIIFTYEFYFINYNSEHLSIIKLENTFYKWWQMEKSVMTILYKEIYNKFINCLLQRGLF